MLDSGSITSYRLRIDKSDQLAHFRFFPFRKKEEEEEEEEEEEKETVTSLNIFFLEYFVSAGNGIEATWL